MTNKIFFKVNLKTLFLLIFFFIFLKREALCYEDPVHMLKKTTKNVVNALNEKENDIENNKKNVHKEIYDIINKLIIPNVDLQEMSRWIMGRNTWQKSTKGEKSKFIIAFKDLLIKNYYVTLNDYKKHEMEFLPIQEEYLKKKYIIIKSIINKKDNNKLLYIDYRLINKKGRWKVFDIVVENVSLLKAYQSQYSNKIRKNGLKKVTNEIITNLKNS